MGKGLKYVKFISKEKIGNHSIITVETESGILFWKKKNQTKYQSIDGRVFASIRDWVKLPDQIEVGIVMRSQLETWDRLN